MNDKNNNIQPEDVATQSPGVILREAREKSQLTIEEIASKLRLGTDVINNIENDRNDALPAPIFVRGYLKSYAALVGVDPVRVTQSYGQLTDTDNWEISLGAGRETMSVKARHPAKNQLAVGLIVGLLLVLGIILWLSQDGEAEQSPVLATESQLSEEDPEKLVSSKPSVETQTITSVPQTSTTESQTVTPPQIAEESEPETTALVTAKTTSAQTPQDRSAPVKTAPEPTTDSSDEASSPVKTRVDWLEFIFAGDSWVDVRDADGKRLIYRMVKSGERRRVSGSPPFKITLGNAPQSELLRNDVRIDLRPYTRGNVAKFSLGKINE